MRLRTKCDILGTAPAVSEQFVRAPSHPIPFPIGFEA